MRDKKVHAQPQLSNRAPRAAQSGYHERCQCDNTQTLLTSSTSSSMLHDETVNRSNAPMPEFPLLTQ